MNFKKKYLKYKLKYLELKKQIGGTIPQNFIELSNKYVRYKPKYTYPMDMELAYRYADSFCLKKEQTFLRKLFENTVHVSFNEFLSKLKICIENFIKKIGKKKFILYTKTMYDENDKENIKSNQWLSYISYPLLKDYNIYVVQDEKELIKYIEDYNIKNILIIDDATYSGTQLRDNIEDLINNIKDKDKKKKIIELGNKYYYPPEQQKLIDAVPYYTDFRINVVIPYISKQFLDKLKKSKNDKFSDIYYDTIMNKCDDIINPKQENIKYPAEIIKLEKDILKDISENKNDPTNEILMEHLNNRKEKFRVNNKINCHNEFDKFGLHAKGDIMYYFDHKMADFKSVPGMLLNALVESKYPNLYTERDRIELGANRDIKYPKDLDYCDDKSKKHSRHNIPIIKNCYVNNDDRSGNCPPAFYKEKELSAGLTSKDYRIELPQGKSIWDELN